MARFRALGRVPRLLLLTVAGLAATAGVAVATTMATNAFTDPQGVYHGCAGNGSGILRVVTPGDSCKPSETAIDWNRTGPQGPQGIQGPKGDTGPQGPAGQQGPPGPAFVGSPCAPPSGAPGTVQTSVAPSGAISFTCATTGGDPGGDGGGGSSLCPDPLPAYPHGHAVCDDSSGTVFFTCDFGWADANGQIDDGCEQQSVAAEVCNGLDDDHDGVVDDNLTDVPALPHATAACAPSQGGYVIQACDPGWQDADGIVADGCEKQL